ncbi:MAG: bifunctional phosphoribosylaminoimidazolecarboxamide formyltransferase/IMP cyclohydrolase PurH, partial [Firmicutes bacterium]|nr:bifunctional phosphoribosylaminoimidazolecarboxamide formyltransferase/IMP cyclohydrolase PurH [Bacillota bacterium]
GPAAEELARALVEVFLEVVVAKGYTPSALAILAQKKNLRVLEMLTSAPHDLEVRMVAGGFLAQESDRLKTRARDFRHVAGPLVHQWTDVDLAWRTAAHVRSNAIVIARDGATVGIGGGETNRIDAARHALERAGDRAQGAVLASDGFFPFGDVVLAAAEYGIRVVVEPGGALRDQESVNAADNAGITLIFTGERHFRH